MKSLLIKRIRSLALAALNGMIAMSVLSSGLSSTIVQAQDQQATDVSQIKLLDGFEAELVYNVPTDKQGSWVNMTVDPKGRLITSDQYGKLYRVTPVGIEGATETKVEPLAADIGMAQGLLCAFDSLYVMVNGNAAEGAGLYRLQDLDGDDQFEKVTLLRKINGGGEHGPHAIILSPTGDSLYVCGGNHTDIPSPEESLVPRNWDEDQVLPRMWDAGGHAVGKMAPGGWICETDPEGKSFKLISSGFRNEYDIAFNKAGDLFSYDADMEWDVGSPWYRPTRVCHATAGSEFGWRSGTGKWPVSYPDSLPPVVDIGPGSPTGIAFGYGAKFPAKYQQALYISDWSYGIIYAVHMTPVGGSYEATFEKFCSAPALQVADVIVNPVDQALYFVIGGRRTQSGLYRVSYKGDESTEVADVIQVTPNGVLRRKLEGLIGDTSEEALATAWENMGHEDRFVRYAARMVVEHIPVEKWADKATSEKDAETALNAIVALARCGSEEHQAAATTSLERLNWDSLNHLQKVALMRAYGLILVRLGESNAETKSTIVSDLSSQYPAGNAELDRELCRILVAAESSSVASKTLELLANAPTQEEQIHYALCLRVLKTGWTLDLRKQYLEWFNQAGAYRGGNSFNGFLANIRKEAIENLDEKDREALADVINTQPKQIDVIAELKKRPLVKDWKVSDLLSSAEDKLVDRDFEQGKRIFSEATCYKCHRFAGEGGIVGPDLTAAGRRFNKQNLLEALVEPSLVVSDQYQATVFITEDGRQVVGRVVNLSGNNYMVQEDMLNPGRLTGVNRNQVEEMIPSDVSMMPEGLLDTFTEEEILDLLAYVRSGGDPEGPELKKNSGTKPEPQQ